MSHNSVVRHILLAHSVVDGGIETNWRVGARKERHSISILTSRFLSIQSPSLAFELDSLLILDKHVVILSLRVSDERLETRRQISTDFPERFVESSERDSSSKAIHSILYNL